MFEKIFQIDGSNQENIAGDIEKAGFSLVSMNQPVPLDEMKAVIGTLSASVQRKLSDGRASIIPRGRAEFVSQRGSVTSIDFDIMENQMTSSDPVIIVREEMPGKVSIVIREILEERVTLDIIKSALSSMTNRKFKTSVNDLARLTGENPKTAYNRCVDMLVRSCVSGFRRIDVTEADLLPKKTARTPIEVKPA